MSKIKHNENFICHVKVNQLTFERKTPVCPEKFIRTLYEDGWKIIHLRRENKAKQAISNIIAEIRQGYHKVDDKDEVFNLDIDCCDLCKRIRMRLLYDSMERESLKDIEHYKITYEEDLERVDDHQATLNNIFDYIGLEKRIVKTRFKKINKITLKKIINNYQEYVHCLEINGWNTFLD